MKEYVSKEYVDGKTTICEMLMLVKCHECAAWKPNKEIPGAGKCVRLSMITRGGFFCANGSEKIPTLTETELDFSGIFGDEYGN